MRNISSRFLTMKELEIGKTKGTFYEKTFNFVYQGPLVFPISYSFMVKNQFGIERWKTCGPYCTSQFSTLFFILCDRDTKPHECHIYCLPIHILIVSYATNIQINGLDT